MPKIIVELKDCRKCPKFDERDGEYVSPDSFEAPNHDWYCKENSEKIRGYVEWNERNKIPIPDWCPLLLENVTKKPEIPVFKCNNCHDTGQYSYGGSFGGPSYTSKCPCQIIKTKEDDNN